MKSKDREEKGRVKLTRRRFIGIGGMATAGASLPAAIWASSSREGEANPEKSKAVATDWRIPPEPIPESKITKEYTADVVVVGLGHAGAPAARAAAEAGASVIGVEKNTPDVLHALGMDVGHINSDFLASRGVPKVDPIELFNDWMHRSGNRANPSLVMQYCQKCGQAFDWYCEPFTEEQMAKVVIGFWPPPAKNFKGQISGQKFWVGTARFQREQEPFRVNKESLQKEESAEEKATEKLNGPDPEEPKNIFTLTKTTWGNLERAREHGADLHFGIDAQQLVKEGERVTGVIAKDSKGKHIRFNAKKGVILSTGDFGANKEMCRDLLTDVSDLFEEGEDFQIGFRDGRGIQMGVWAGGRMEARPVPTMGGNFILMSGGAAGTFGGIPWLDESGRRFCNEGFGDPIFAGMPGAAMKHGMITAVFDSSIMEDVQCSPPAHLSFWYGGEDAGRALVDNMAAARKADAKGHELAAYGMTGTPTRLYAADTLEQLADYAGFKGEVRQNFFDSIKRYNKFAAAGRDEDFGKDPQMLHAIDTPPYYANPVKASQMIGSGHCTVGGLLTNEHQNVLNQKKDPIPGLYATGNCCGRRFGPQYSTPIAGVSIGIAITLGREVGRIVASL